MSRRTASHEQYTIETSLVSCCFASSKIPQYNGSGIMPLYKSTWKSQLLNDEQYNMRTAH
jgi:hypothetical protein